MCLLNCNTKKKGYNNQNKATKIIASALDRTERRNRSKFYRTFNTITFDNRVEFIGYKGIDIGIIKLSYIKMVENW